MIEPATRPLEWSPPRTAISRIPYLPGLDGMRALAVLAVMVYHANPAWLPGGFLGVEVFFVISGYLITLLIIGEHESHRHRQPAALLAPAGPAAAAGAVHAAHRDHDLHGAVPPRRARSAARRRPRRAGLRVQLVPDLGRSGLHGIGRLLAAAPPVEPRRRGAVLPALAAGHGRPDRPRPASPARDEPVAVPRRRRHHRRHGAPLLPGADRELLGDAGRLLAGRRPLHLQDRRPVPRRRRRGPPGCCSARPSPCSGGRSR